MENKRINAFFTGTVQGVGFRYTTERIALNLEVKGWVKNLPGGRVELVAEGTEAKLSELLEKIQDRFGNYIKDVEVDWLEASGEFKGFSVEF